MENGNKSCCPCHKMVKGVLIILFGLTFLLRELEVLNLHTANIIWPSILVLGGLQQMFKGMCKRCKPGDQGQSCK